MPTPEQLLKELHEGLTDPVHKRLIAAYRENPGYETLLEVCKEEIEAKVNEIENPHSAGNKGL